MSEPQPDPPPHKRRVRYRGTHPRRFEEKYKELQPEKYAETVGKVLASGKTPAGAHRPICVDEIVQSLDPKPGETYLDATLGYGGHAMAILPRTLPGGRLIGLDVDPLELPKTEQRLKEKFPGENIAVHRTNFAAIGKTLREEGIAGVDMVLADLGVSSMQIDNPARGFTFKVDGPLDLRMNPSKGEPASALLARLKMDELVELLKENADEPHAEAIARAILGARPEVQTTEQLARVIRGALRKQSPDNQTNAIRRVFQALRIMVNDEFGALESFLAQLPACLNSQGRLAILSFHSGEDRRVKAALKKGHQTGVYQSISGEVIRPSPREIFENPRAASAKLRWAIRSAA